MKLEFVKMHGLGNDFMVIDAINQPFRPLAGQVKNWADRHSGIGFDQMLIIESAESEQAEFKYRIFNADGTEVSQCGNGARCFARFVRDQGLSDHRIIPVETNTGLIRLEIIDATQVRVDMGKPVFEPAAIPLRVDKQEQLYAVDYAGQTIHFSALSMGNPHMVIPVEHLDNVDIESMGSYFESHHLFPERTNVGFMQIVDRDYFKLRVFERGAGETRACGSGACAAIVAGVQLGLLNHNARAGLPGGDLNLEWQGGENPVMMTGPTAIVFRGEIEYE